MGATPAIFRESAFRAMSTLTLFLFLAGCQDSDPIRLGFVAGLSGRVADLGVSGRDAAQLAVEERNQSGGVRGRKVVLSVKDDRQDPEAARQAVRELIAEGVAAIVGPMTSDMGLAVVPIANEAGILLMSPTVSTEALSGIDDQFFRVTATTRDFATHNAHYQIRARRMRRVAAAFDLGNRAYTEAWLRHFREAFTAKGGEIVASLGFTTGGETTFLDLARDLMASLPDGVLIIANSMDSALLCRQIRKLDASVPITIADWGASERLLELGGKAVEGVTVVQSFDRDSTAPRYRAFRRTYVERFGREPGFAGVDAYEAVNVVLDAIQHRGKGQSLKESVLAIRHFEGLQVPFSFDDYGDVRRPATSISVVRDGEFAVLE